MKHALSWLVCPQFGRRGEGRDPSLSSQCICEVWSAAFAGVTLNNGARNQ